MGYRLSHIVTRTGDDGSTGLGDGSRIGKDALRIVTLGDIDELNSLLGVLLAETLPESIIECLLMIQHDIFDLGAELAVPGQWVLKSSQVLALEQWVVEFNATLPPLTEFILPGGCRPAALAHQVRAGCRRAERSLVALAHDEIVSDAACQYLNRLSDLMFVLARSLNKAAGMPDVLWQPGRYSHMTYE